MSEQNDNDGKSKGTSSRLYKVFWEKELTLSGPDPDKGVKHAAYIEVDAIEASSPEAAIRAVYVGDKKRFGQTGALVAVTERSWTRKSFKPKPPADDVPVVFS